MRAALDWSHDLLTVDERAALRRLAVFPDHFDVDATIAVIAGGGPIGESGADGFSLIAELVDRSWIEMVSGGTRYRLLTPVRQYAAERLDAAGETASARRAHRESTSRALRGWPLMTAQQRRSLYADRQNLRAALEWSWDQGDAGAAMELVVVQAVSWMTPSDATAQAWLERVLAEPKTAMHPARVCALASWRSRWATRAPGTTAASWTSSPRP